MTNSPSYDTDDVLRIESAGSAARRSLPVAYILLVLIGFTGAHNFYIGSRLVGGLQLMACGAMILLTSSGPEAAQSAVTLSQGMFVVLISDIFFLPFRGKRNIERQKEATRRKIHQERNLVR